MAACTAQLRANFSRAHAHLGKISEKVSTALCETKNTIETPLEKLANYTDLSPRPPRDIARSRFLNK